MNKNLNNIIYQRRTNLLKTAKKKIKVGENIDI